MRLSIVSLALLSAAFLVATVSLLPALFAAQARLTAIEMQEKLVEESLARRDRDSSTTAVRLVNALLSEVRMYEDQVPLEELVRSTLSGKPAGVTISSLRFLTLAERSELTIRGDAVSREALLSFRRALEGERHFVSVELPISNLAKTRDINFTLKLVLAKPL